MAYVKLCIFALLALGALAAKDQKEGKQWSIFSVVSFENRPCRSESGPTTTAGVNRNGTCYTSSECTSKGGRASGNCASGFGVCCLFLVTETANTIEHNNTYLQNPGFPTVLSTTASLAYMVKKQMNDICMLRLDFEQFVIEGVTAFDDTGVCTDSFAVTTSVKTVAYPVICGVNSGQHMYIDMTRDNAATATLTFTFAATPASTKRTWDIRVAQIECESTSLPFDSGCLQYLTGTTGRFSSFNFGEATVAAQHHLPDQRYGICIRQEAHFCCVEYGICSDTKSFLISSMAAMSSTHSNCALDFLTISGAQATCENASNIPKDSRVCGEKFNIVEASGLDAFICDCSAPFVVDVNFDAAAIDGATGNQRGFCLEYRQRPC